MSKGRMLEGVRVVDLTSVVFGPYATYLLAESGADVIKVEPPQGDQLRQIGKPAKTRGMGPSYMTVNRGKRSVMLDLKTEAGREIMAALLKTADIFIHNVRGKAIARLGFDYPAVKALNPGIIYVHCVGFGSGGPYADLPAYDDVIQAASGAASLNPRVVGGPPRYIPSLIADKVSGLYAANAVLTAYAHKLRSGEGQSVEVPMLEAFTQFMLLEHLGGKAFDPPNAPVCYDRQIDPARQPFPTADGHISIVAYTDGSWATVFGILGDTSILEEERFSTPLGRFRNVSLLYREIARLTPARTTAEWMALFREVGVPAMVAHDIDDILEDPHLSETGFFAHETHPSEGGFVAMGRPVHYSADPQRNLTPAPNLGQDTEAVLHELGLPPRRGSDPAAD